MSAADAIPQPVRELAEAPGRYTRLTPGHVDRVETDRFVVVRGGWWASVDGVRAVPDEVEEIVCAVRELTVDRAAMWRIGPSTTPADFEERLRALGLRTPANGVEELGALATVTAPDAPRTEVRRVETLDDYRTAVELRVRPFRRLPKARRGELGDEAERVGALWALEPVLRVS